MYSTTVTLPEIHLIGISARTSNMREMNPVNAKIGVTAGSYFQKGLAAKTLHRKTPGVTYCVYTDYESDFTGDYTYFIGEEVTSVSDLPEDCRSLIITPQTYIKFTTEPGSMPQVCITAWQAIWKMTTVALGGSRRYTADFEVYDTRAADPQNTILDIYVGIQE